MVKETEEKPAAEPEGAPAGDDSGEGKAGLGQTLIESSLGRSDVRETEVELGHQTGAPAEGESALEVAIDPNYKLGSAAKPVETLREGTMSAMLGGAMDRLTNAVGATPGFRPKMPPGFVPENSRKKHGPEKRPVRCFSCNHQQPVSVAAASTQCERCSVYISLADHDITIPSSQNIRTRGKVRVRRRGSLMGCDVACHDLLVEGQVSASIDCSGDAIFDHSARVMGSMHCRHLTVEKRCEVSFPQGVVAENVDVFGTVLGNVICGGTIRIHKTGSIQGNATAKAIELKEGGILTGKMSIQPHLVTALPEKKGYLRNEE